MRNLTTATEQYAMQEALPPGDLEEKIIRINIRIAVILFDGFIGSLGLTCREQRQNKQNIAWRMA
jgi:hypothetical protein